MDTCETVRIVGDAPGGYVVINKEDFVEGEQVLFVDPTENLVLNVATPEAGQALVAEHNANVDAVLDQVAKRKPRRKETA